MKIFHRYIFREILGFFCVALFVFLGVLLTIRMLRFASLIVDKGVMFSQIAQVFFAIIPTFLEVAMPLATLLGVMLAFARLSGDSEIVIMRASGLSYYSLLMPVIIFGLCVGILGLYISQMLKPIAHQRLALILFEIARSKSTSGLEEAVFNQLGRITLYTEKIDYGQGLLKHVLVDDRRDVNMPRLVVATRGRISSDPERKVIMLLLTNGTIHELVDGKYVLTEFESNRLVLDPEQLFETEEKRGRQIDEMFISELKERSAYLERLKDFLPVDATIEAHEYPVPLPPSVTPDTLSYQSLVKKLQRTKVEMGKRYSLPCAAFLLALLAFPLGIQPTRAQRAWGIGLSVMLGLLAFVIYYGSFSLGLVLAQNGIINTYVALWLPNLITVCLAVYLLHMLANERWQSITQALEAFVSGLRRFKCGFWKTKKKEAALL